MLFSSPSRRRKPGPKGPSTELIGAIVELKRRNPQFGCVRVAQQISYAFGIDLDKDVVRRALAKHYRPESGSDGPSWLTFIGHVKDSLWSVDMLRCESILLRSHWVMPVMDVFTRRIIGSGVAPAYIEGASVCRMFNDATAGQPRPKHLSTDHDSLFRFHRWLAARSAIYYCSLRPNDNPSQSFPSLGIFFDLLKKSAPARKPMLNASLISTT